MADYNINMLTSQIKDKSKKEKEIIREKEDFYLSLQT